MRLSFFWHWSPRNWHFRLALDRHSGLTYFKFQLLPLAAVATWKNSHPTP